MVEAIETFFVPVVIHNNKDGKDAEVLKRFGEPAWNNPVVRFLDGSGKDLIPRKDGIYTCSGLALRIKSALETDRKSTPPWFEEMLVDGESRHLQTAVFSMHCFWEGEAKLGSSDGVVATEAGFAGGEEVVKVTFDPGRIAFKDLIRRALAIECAQKVFVQPGSMESEAKEVAGSRVRPLSEPPKRAPESDQKHALKASHLRFLPMTDLQATKVNAALAKGEEPSSSLSPRQLKLGAEIRAALSKSPALLDGLEPPSQILEAGSYVSKLRKRLSGN